MKNDQKIPFLPGMNFEDPDKENFKKIQNFTVSQGAMICKKDLVDTNMNSDLIPQFHQTLQALKQKKKVQKQQKFKTSQMDYDLKSEYRPIEILRYYAYFDQKMIQTRIEQFCQRKVIISYFLSDDTLKITEPPTNNSGIVQGIYLARQRAFKDKKFEQPISLQDLKVGNEINIFCTKFYIYDCDSNTRIFYQQIEDKQKKQQPIPEDKFQQYQQSQKYKLEDPQIAQYKKYCEVALGGGHSNEGLEKYLANDKKTLSFDVIWNDTSFSGDINRYKLNYHLADDKIEIKEMNTPNNGKRPFPLFLKKEKLPKEIILSHYPGLQDKPQQYYSVEDLIIGQTIMVYNRPFLLINCDQFTKQYFMEHLNIYQEKLEIDQLKQQKKNTILKIPPYNGFGSEVDSLGNCFNLIPKPPKIDLAKKFMYNRVVLRFLCRKISNQQSIQDQKYLLSFYCGDDTISIHLKTGKNSGIQNGKYLEQNKYKNDLTGKFYTTKDLCMGQVLNINKQQFQIVSGDQFSLNFMFQKPEMFPLCNTFQIEKNLKQQFKIFQNFDSFKNQFLDLIQEDKIDFKTLQEIMKKLNVISQYHETFFLFYLCQIDQSKKADTYEILNLIKTKLFAN